MSIGHRPNTLKGFSAKLTHKLKRNSKRSRAMEPLAATAPNSFNFATPQQRLPTTQLFISCLTLPVSDDDDTHQCQLRPNARRVVFSATKLPPRPWTSAPRTAATSKTPFVRSATKRTRRSSTTRTGASRRKLEDPGVSLTEQPTRRRTNPRIWYSLTSKPTAHGSYASSSRKSPAADLRNLPRFRLSCAAG